MGVLNLRHGTYVINGLNQRHFTPYIHGAPVVSDAQSDIARCFDPRTEILVFEDAAELNVIQADLVRHPERGRAVATAGRRRVLAQHTYAHRLDDMAELVGVKKSGPSR